MTKEQVINNLSKKEMFYGKKDTLVKDIEFEQDSNSNENKYKHLAAVDK